MNHKERRQLENFLLVEGLAHLGDPELIQQLANMVTAWRGDRHQFLQDLLNECEPDQRYEMYQAIAPKLGFRPLPLQTYECRIAEQAGAAVSRRQMRVEGADPRPIEIGDRVYVKVPKAIASQALATLTCHQCGIKDKFLADTPVGAMIEGRKAGWVRDLSVDKELCPECRAVGQKIGSA